jgi:hypothetical protein
VNLTEIIAEIDEKYPNAFTNDSKVRKINKLQKKIFRRHVTRTVVESVAILTGVPVYPLTYSPEKIREVLVNGKKYEYRQLESDGLAEFYYELDAGIGIYPTPTEDGTMIIYHYQEPAPLSASDLSASPDLDEDYHDLLVYGVCKELAESYKEFDTANGFVTQYKEELNNFLDANQSTEPSEIQEEGRW